MLPPERQEAYLARTWKKKLRWVMLFLCMMYVVSVNFCIDYPASLETQIETQFDVSNSKYGLLYSYFALPNAIMPIVGGVFFDKLGIRSGLILFTSIVCVGQGMFMLGGYNMDFNLMLWGRIVFGIGCEAMIVGQSAVTSAWFLNFELPFAMSMIVCFPLLGSFIQGSTIPTVYDANGFGWAFAIGFILCCASLCMVITIALIDRLTNKADDIILDKYVDEILLAN